MRTLLFDIDGTLLVSDGGGRRAFEQAFRLEFGIAEADIDVPFSGRTDAGLIAELLLRNGVPAGPRERGRLRRRYASCLPAAIFSDMTDVSALFSLLVGETDGRSFF